MSARSTSRTPAPFHAGTSPPGPGAPTARKRPGGGVGNASLARHQRNVQRQPKSFRDC